MRWLGGGDAAHRATGKGVEHDDGAVVAARRATGARTSHDGQHRVESQQRVPVSVVPAASRAIPCPSSASSRPRPESIPRSFHCRLRACQRLNAVTGLHDYGDGLALLWCVNMVRGRAPASSLAARRAPTWEER
eukprot:scaffold96198_cov69-Phaeocystis_antarctica.AAC.1